MRNHLIKLTKKKNKKDLITLTRTVHSHNASNISETRRKIIHVNVLQAVFSICLDVVPASLVQVVDECMVQEEHGIARAAEDAGHVAARSERRVHVAMAHLEGVNPREAEISMRKDVFHELDIVVIEVREDIGYDVSLESRMDASTHGTWGRPVGGKTRDHSTDGISGQERREED